MFCLDQGWAIIYPNRPHRVLDLDERPGQQVQETNPLNEDWRLTKNHAWRLTEKEPENLLFYLQLEMADDVLAPPFFF